MEALSTDHKHCFLYIFLYDVFVHGCWKNIYIILLYFTIDFYKKRI